MTIAAASIADKPLGWLPTSGALSHDATGALSSQEATLSGSAARSSSVVSHSSTGALSAQEATLSGVAAHYTLHAATGSLVADAAELSGSARDETTYVAPAPKTGAGRAKKSRRRYEVEVDGEVIGVSSPEEAQQVLEQVREKAIQTAQVAVERAAKGVKRPMRQVMRDARKTLEVPQISVSPSLRDYANQIIGDIRAQFDSAYASIEIAARLARREAEIEQDDEEILLLL